MRVVSMERKCILSSNHRRNLPYLYAINLEIELHEEVACLYDGAHLLRPSRCGTVNMTIVSGNDSKSVYYIA